MEMKKLPLLVAAMALITGSAFAQPANNECTGAIDINSAIGQPVGTTTVLGPYDNTTATTAASDPGFGYGCFGEPDGSGTAPTLENTLWFTFTGDGGRYFIETADGPAITNYIDDGDTQIAIYTGTCGALVEFECNEDGPSAGAGGAPPYPAGLSINTSVGQVYYMMIDGFNFNGAISSGEYYVEVTQELTVACSDPSVTLGTYFSDTTQVCPGDTVTFFINGVVTPTVGAVSGLSWIISSADISGSSDPLNDPSVVATYTVQSPAPDSSIRVLVNDGALIGGGNIPYGTYYWTPVIFGNGLPLNPPVTFLSDVLLDSTCTTVGNSIMVNVLAPGDPACAGTGIACNDPSVTLGTYSSNKTFVCPGDTVQFDITGVITPTVGLVSGLSWVITNADISGSTDPLNEPSLQATYTVQSPAPSTSFRLLVNDGALIGGPIPYGTYYWTPVMFGNGTPNITPIAFLSDVTLDPTCTTSGNSIMVDVLAPGDPQCAVGLADINDNGFGISSIYPVPVATNLNFNVQSVDNGIVEVLIIDNLGRSVMADQVTLTAGETQFKYNVESFVSGIYHIKVTFGTSVSNSKFIKK
jgi:plastocyanin